MASRKRRKHGRFERSNQGRVAALLCPECSEGLSPMVQAPAESHGDGAVGAIAEAIVRFESFLPS